MDKIREDVSLARQELFLNRPHAERVLQIVAAYVHAAIPDAMACLGTSLGCTFMTPTLVARGQKPLPGMPKHSLLTINIAMTYLVFVRDSPNPTFHFLVLESPLAHRAAEQLTSLGHSAGVRPAQLKPPAKLELWVDGLEAAEAGLAVPALTQALADLAEPFLGRRLFNPGWHDPFAAHLFEGALEN